MVDFFRNIWLRIVGFDEEKFNTLLNDITKSSVNSSFKFKAVRSLYYLSFVPEHREQMKGVHEILHEARRIFPSETERRPTFS